MKYFFVLAIAFSLTLVWQTVNLETQAKNLKSVEYEQTLNKLPEKTT